MSALLLAFPGIVWALHFVAVYLLVSFACVGAGVLMPGSVRSGVGVLTVLAVIVLAWVVVRSVRNAHGNPAGVISKATAGVAMLAFVAVAWAAYPAFVLPPCAR